MNFHSLAAAVKNSFILRDEGGELLIIESLKIGGPSQQSIPLI